MAAAFYGTAHSTLGANPEELNFLRPSGTVAATQLLANLQSAICHRAESASSDASPDLAAIVHDADLARSKKIGDSSDRFLLSVRI